MTHTSSSRSALGWRTGLAVIGAMAALTACKDSNIPFYTAPTSVSATPAGIQNAVTGLFGALRGDIGTMTITVAMGYARDGAVFTNTEPRTVEYPLGVIFTPNTSGGIWTQEYQNIRQAEQILAAIPNTSPAYSAPQTAALTGVVQTMQAYAYMLMAEAHDTLGIAILPASNAGTPPAVCMKDAWLYIVALLDSANTQLTTAGATAPPIVLPKGFAGVGTSSGPGHVSGSFASFNRALQVKALMELAYAKARSHGGNAPTPSSAGLPDAGNLTRALALLDSTAMFDKTGALLAPTTPGGFSPGATTVTHDYSAASGDVVNPIDGQIGTEAVLNDFLADVDTVNDQRFHAKFIINPNPVQQQTYNAVANQTHQVSPGHDTTYSYLYNMGAVPGAPIPIMRAEGLTLIAAEIHLGLGDNAGALALVNQVRTIVGSCGGSCPAGETALVPYPVGDASSYVTTRNDLMREQRISMTWESSADRTIAIRMYGMAAVSDTTWTHEDASVKTPDAHTTVNPIPSAEINGRGGSWSTTCN